MRAGPRVRRRVVGALLALSVTLLGVAPSGAPVTPAVAAPPAEASLALSAALPQSQTVRVGVAATSSEVGLYMAQERGYFAEQGMSADFTRFDSGAFAVAPLSVGELDAASGVVSAALFNAMNRGVEVRLVSPQSRYELGFSQLILDVRKDLADSGAIRDYADLRGRTIGLMSFGSTVEMVAERALARAGLTAADVNLVQMGAGDQLPAFANRAIDAGLLTEPQATVAADRGLAVKWREAAEWSPGVQVSNILYGPNFVSRNSEAGQRFMVAYLKGVRDYYDAIIAGRGGREGIVDVLARHTPLPDRALYDRILPVYMDPNLTLDESDLQATMQWFVDRGTVDRPVDLDTAVARRFAQHALSLLGPHQ